MGAARRDKEKNKFLPFCKVEGLRRASAFPHRFLPLPTASSRLLLLLLTDTLLPTLLLSPLPCRAAATSVVRAGPVPEHVALIMDGNRRFAKQRNIRRIEGHALGFEKLKEVRPDWLNQSRAQRLQWGLCGVQARERNCRGPGFPSSTSGWGQMEKKKVGRHTFVRRAEWQE